MTGLTELLTPAEAATLLKLSTKRVRSLVKEGLLPGIVAGRMIRVDGGRLQEMVKAARADGAAS